MPAVIGISSTDIGLQQIDSNKLTIIPCFTNHYHHVVIRLRHECDVTNNPTYVECSLAIGLA